MCYNRSMWVGNQFYYTRNLLTTIASNYHSLYEGLPVNSGNALIVNPWRLAEYKADFDIALGNLGEGKWRGELDPDFRKYNHFGSLQRVVIADIGGLTEHDLEIRGFYDVPKLRGIAYYLMMQFLNGGDFDTRTKRVGN